MKIKQILLLGSVFCILMSCYSEKIVVNKKIINTEGEPMLIGRITPEALTAPEFNDWYSKEYNSYIPNKKIINKLKSKTEFYRIEIFLGTWSDDTQIQLPRFLKILTCLKFPEKNIALYALNRNRESFYGEQSQKAINKIPVFIIYRRNKEMGRIVEAPTGKTLEDDLYKIITGKEINN